MTFEQNYERAKADTNRVLKRTLDEMRERRKRAENHADRIDEFNKRNANGERDMDDRVPHLSRVPVEF